MSPLLPATRGRFFSWWLGLVTGLGLLIAPGCGDAPATRAPNSGVGKLNAVPIAAVDGTHLKNLHRLAAKVYAGALPEGDAAFADLAKLGVKTIVSVDGATPDQATAAKFGLRYIHLPIGYDGVPVATQEAIAKLIVEADSPVYIHCHHGKHRSAAAAASACVVAGLMDEAHALEALHQMQTGQEYSGLWQDVREARPRLAADLRALQIEYQAAQPLPALAEAMVQIDEINERLKLCKAAGWQTPPQHQDVTPAHEALMLKEHFSEIRRTPDCAAQPQDFQAWAQATETAAAGLESSLQAGQPVAESTAAWDRLQASCLACHAKYRNVPQGP